MRDPIPKPIRVKPSLAAKDKAWKLQVRQRYDNTCQECGVYGLYLHAHHIAARTQRPELRHDVDNGILLCFSCHAYVHAHPTWAKNWGYISDERYENKKKPS